MEEVNTHTAASKTGQISFVGLFGNEINGKTINKIEIPLIQRDYAQGRQGEIVTLVYTPLIDESFGAEYVRVNLDAYLRQENINQNTKKTSFVGRLDSDADFDKAIEKERIGNGAKWWPIKRYSGSFKKGKGNSSNWRLVVDSLTRAAQDFPPEGISFSVVLTISDIEQEKPVFNQMRRTLQTQGAVIRDIRTALKVRP